MSMEEYDRIGIGNGGLVFRSDKQELIQENSRLKKELATVDEALARRPALADIPDRYSKISKACFEASKVEKLQEQLSAAQGMVKELEKEVARLQVNEFFCTRCGKKCMGLRFCQDCAIPKDGDAL